MPSHVPMDELSTVLARINGLLLTEEQATHAVGLLAKAAKDMVPGAVGAGVSVFDPDGRGATVGASDKLVREADGHQYRLGQGPCLEAWRTSSTVVGNSIPGDSRWSRWSEAVSGLPVAAVASTPLVAGGQCVGTLKVYVGGSAGLGEESVRTLELLAGAAAVLLRGIQTNETPRRIGKLLENALTSRDTVSRACGVLMERHGISEEAAMRRLLSAARSDSSVILAAQRVVSGIQTNRD